MSGYLASVPITDNQHVAAGDVIAASMPPALTLRKVKLGGLVHMED